MNHDQQNSYGTYRIVRGKSMADLNRSRKENKHHLDHAERTLGSMSDRNTKGFERKVVNGMTMIHSAKSKALKNKSK